MSARAILAAFLLCVRVPLGTATSFDIWDYELTINVSSLFGNDTLECLAGLVPCETLGYALTGLDNSTAILMTEGDDYLFDRGPIVVSGAKNVAIVGENDNAVVSCEAGSGIGFVDSGDVLVRGIHWAGCAAAHPSTALHLESEVAFPDTTSALYFARCLNVTIADCSFSSRNGSGVSMFDVGGDVLVQRSNFTGHTASPEKQCGVELEPCLLLSRGLSVEFTYCGGFRNCSEPGPASLYNSGARYVIEDCIFFGNNNSHGGVRTSVESLEGEEYWPYGKGGAMAISFRGRSSGNSVVVNYSNGFAAISSSAFSWNAADVGGSLFVEFLDEASGNNVSWIGPAAVSASSAEMGGAVHISVGVWLQRTKGGSGANGILLKDIEIINNQATWGGGVTLVNLPSSDGSATVAFQNCSFLLNSAKTGADAVGLSQLSTSGISGMVVSFKNCTFQKNDFARSIAPVSAYQSQSTAHCSISTDGLPLILDTAIVSDSSGPALCASSATVHVRGDVRFVSNGLRTQPVCGGGVLLQSSSALVLSKGVRFLLQNNTALYYGGGVYFGGASTSLPRARRGGQRLSQSASSCPFEYEDVLVPVDAWSAETRVTFSGNRIADPRGTGRSMYLAGIADEQCRRLMANVTGVPDSDSVPRGDFASMGTSVQLHPPAEQIGPDSYTMETMLGQFLTLNATATDYYGNVVEMALRLVSLDSMTMRPVVSVVGPTSVVIRDGPSHTGAYLQGVEGDARGGGGAVETEIYLLLTDLANTYSSVRVRFVTRLGFVFDPSRRIYTCYGSDKVICNRTSLEVCVQGGYWYGELQTGINKTTSFVAPCILDHCRYADGRCPAHAGSCSNLNSFCLLPAGDQDEQCAENRGGVFCSSCRTNYSFTYDAVTCAPSHTCSAAHAAFFVACVVLFWGMVGAFSVILWKLNAKLGAGCTFSFLYYFSVVRLVLPPTLPSQFLTILVDVFSGIIQLNPRFLGWVQWCAFWSLGNIGYWVLRYLHPLVFILVMAAMVLLRWGSSQFPCLGAIPSTHFACILLLLAFSSLTEVSLTLLTAVRVNDALYVAVEPSIEYFEERSHFPWAFVAMAVELFVLVPMVIFLVLGSLIGRLKCSQDTQLGGVLSEYQVCYRKGLRWAASFYFVARQAMFLVPPLCFLAEGSSTNILQVLTVFLAVFHTALQPYRASWLNMADTLFLFNLALVALLGSMGLPSLITSVLLHALVLVPCAYPAMVLVWLWGTQLRGRLKRSSHEEFSDMSIMAERKTFRGSDLSGNHARYESLMEVQPKKKDHYHSISIL